MEDWMDVYGWGKIESERRSANWTNHTEGAEATNIQLGGRTNCSDVLCMIMSHVLAFRFATRFRLACRQFSRPIVYSV